MVGNLCLGFGNSSLELHFADFGIFGASQTPSLVSRPKILTNTKPPPQFLPLRFVARIDCESNAESIKKGDSTFGESQK